MMAQFLIRQESEQFANLGGMTVHFRLVHERGSADEVVLVAQDGHAEIALEPSA